MRMSWGNPISRVDPTGLSPGYFIPDSDGGGITYHPRVAAAMEQTGGMSVTCYVSCRTMAAAPSYVVTSTLSMAAAGMCAAGGSVAGPVGDVGGAMVGSAAGRAGGMVLTGFVSNAVCSTVCRP